MSLCTEVDCVALASAHCRGRVVKWLDSVLYVDAPLDVALLYATHGSLIMVRYRGGLPGRCTTHGVRAVQLQQERSPSGGGAAAVGM